MQIKIFYAINKSKFLIVISSVHVCANQFINCSVCY